MLVTLTTNSGAGFNGVKIYTGRFNLREMRRLDQICADFEPILDIGTCLEMMPRRIRAAIESCPSKEDEQPVSAMAKFFNKQQFSHSDFVIQIQLLGYVPQRVRVTVPSQSGIFRYYVWVWGPRDATSPSHAGLSKVSPQ